MTVYTGSMSGPADASGAEAIDYEAIRRRFPWVGCFDSDEDDLSSRYRDMMAEALRDREIVEAIDAARHRP
ncbi:hypothetical protein [Streptosporangium sp. NBC_01756]|uniref:hypothetical protein n=1 Tax=Streptosporangium sp. NBC_01756 TaxID=2975950 RepID=UPI002DDB849E|nr:hypothetical protein [Streptosporangium sp. NBC_01756]WSC86022.1 hypothetical protein OIE48_37605 [Streptosporangium sp. NBC_01756]